MPIPVERARASVYRAVAEFADGEGASIPASPDTVLLGAGGAVDSLGLVRLIMMIEAQVERDLGIAISLTDEKAMSQRNSPFRTLGTLVDYIAAAATE